MEAPQQAPMKPTMEEKLAFSQSLRAPTMESMEGEHLKPEDPALAAKMIIIKGCVCWVTTLNTDPRICFGCERSGICLCHAFNDRVCIWKPEGVDPDVLCLCHGGETTLNMPAPICASQERYHCWEYRFACPPGSSKGKPVPNVIAAHFLTCAKDFQPFIKCCATMADVLPESAMAAPADNKQ